MLALRILQTVVTWFVLCCAMTLIAVLAAHTTGYEPSEDETKVLSDLILIVASGVAGYGYRASEDD